MIIPETVKLVYCYFGNGIALGAYGPKTDIERTLNLLFNYGAHDDDKTRFLSETFGYVLTNKKQVAKGLAAACVTHNVKAKIQESKEARGDVWPQALAQASGLFGAIESEPFLTPTASNREYSEPSTYDTKNAQS